MAFAPDERDQTFAADHFAANVAREVSSVWREQVGILLGRAGAEETRILRAQVLNLSAIRCGQTDLRRERRGHHDHDQQRGRNAESYSHRSSITAGHARFHGHRPRLAAAARPRETA